MGLLYLNGCARLLLATPILRKQGNKNFRCPCTANIFTFISLYSFLILATVTLSSSVDGRRACPGELVTYTCSAIGVANLQWTAEPFLSGGPAGNNAIIFLRTDTVRVGQTVNCVDRPMQDCADFQAILLSITNSQGGVADMVSTLAVTAAARLNETVVQCRGTTATELPTANKSITIASMLPRHVLHLHCQNAFRMIHLKYICTSNPPPPLPLPPPMHQVPLLLLSFRLPPTLFRSMIETM